MSQLILIAGVSRSGKSTLAKELCTRLEKSIHLDQDKFVKPEAEIPSIRNRVDWERPESIDWDKWKSSIHKALSEYRFVIAEGIFAFGDQALIKEASLTVLLSISHEEFLTRRAKEKRWGEEPRWFIEHVWQAHLEHHNPFHIQPSFEFSSTTDNHIAQIVSQLQSN